MAYYKDSPSNLTKTITIRCTEEQKNAWQKNAKACGLPLNTYIRIACSYLADKEKNVGVLRYYNLKAEEIEEGNAETSH